MIKALSSWLGRVRDRARKAEKAKEPTTRLGPIDLSPSQRERVEKKIAEFLEDSTSAHSDVRGCVAKANALPLYFGWTAFLGLRPDGHVVEVPYEDESGEVTIEEDPLWRNLALYTGKKKHYPDLDFLGLRPPNAIDCPGCRGTGKAMIPQGYEHLSEVVHCNCGGLGWLPRNVKP